MKRKIFPFMLMFAILFSLLGVVSSNLTLAKPITTNNYSFNMVVDNVATNNIDVYYYEKTNLSYSILLDQYIKDYSISFDVLNDSSFDVKLTNTIMQGIPDELKDILIPQIDVKDRIEINQKYKCFIKYKLKENLTNKELEIVKKYNNIGVNVILNYNQE